LIARFLSSSLGKKLNLARCYDVRLVVYLKGIKSSAIYIYIYIIFGVCTLISVWDKLFVMLDCVFPVQVCIEVIKLSKLRWKALM